MKSLENVTAMTFGTDIHVRMNCNNIGDPLTCHIAPSSGQISNANALK